MMEDSKNSFKRPEIYTYLDLRLFLSDTYQYLKSTRRRFSFRTFSSTAGFRSPSVLKLAIDGKRKLSVASIHKFASALYLKKSEIVFFETLVLFSQGKSAKEKEIHFQKLQRLNRLKSSRRLDSEVAQYFQHWYHIAIRELIQSASCYVDSKLIAQKLSPRISENQASESLKVLMELGMIEKDEKSGYKTVDRLLRTNKEVDYLAIGKFHLEMIENAKKALEFLESTERDISSITLTVNAENLSQLKQEVQSFRQALLAKYDSSDSFSSKVYQLNFQLFPLTLELRRGSDE